MGIRADEPRRMTDALKNVLVVGGAGFIGSHFVDHLIGGARTDRVRIYDNFTSGREWHFTHHRNDPRFSVVRGEVADTDSLVAAMAGYDTVIHLASNPDIAAAMTNPRVDFDEGTALTHSVLEAMRRSESRMILYASGSGVYGALGTSEGVEDHTVLRPVSTYGASKLAGESLIGAYAHMFGIRGFGFRFGNVVGPRQTHGVGFDFIRRLLVDPSQLSILGDGKQSKSYIHVEDVVSAVLMVARTCSSQFDVFNVATLDYITVSEIADLAVSVLGIPHDSVRFRFTGGDRGWKGDVPIVRLNTAKLRALGWNNQRSCRQAIVDSLAQLVPDAKSGKL